MSELILKEDALDCFHDWIDRYGYEHTADEDQVYQRIEALDAVRCCDEDCISRRVVIEAIDDIESEVADGFGFQYEKWRKYFCELPAVQPDHVADISKKVEGDCISRQAAIDSLHGHFDGMLETDTWSPCDIYGLIELLPSAQPEQVCVANVTLTDEQVKEVAEKAKNAVISVIEPEPHWIPCSERLPEENGQYLITIKYKHVNDSYEDVYAEHGEWLDGKWDMFCFGHCGEVEDIIAWMPLPEPYKG